MRNGDRQLNKRNNKQCGQNTQTTMKSLQSSQESENTNIIFQRRSPHRLHRPIKGQDKVDGE